MEGSNQYQLIWEEFSANKVHVMVLKIHRAGLASLMG